jgi:hypothetical protein
MDRDLPPELKCFPLHSLIQRHDLQSIDGADFDSERFLPASTFPIEKMAADFEQHAELVLHNLEYLLCVSVHHGDTLFVEVEQRNDGTRWRGEFEAQCELRCSSADCCAVDSSLECIIVCSDKCLLDKSIGGASW